MKNLKVMNMKKLHLTCLGLLVFITACGISSYDNYDSPDATLTGNIVYNGESIPVSYDNVTFELWQSGFGRETPIEVTVAQDGSYSAELFDGDYRLIIPQGQGPFVVPTNTATSSDTVIVEVSGNTIQDIEIIPYYMVRNADFSVSDRTVSANFGLEQIITDDDARGIEYADLYLSKTNFVDGRTSIKTQGIGGAEISDMNNINLSTEAPEITPTQDYVFARIGVKIQNVEDLIFSNIEKIEF
jgi:hypothetical protein